jgi:hypothetical protein
MDYSDGNVLRHYQWGEVHDWHLGINWLVSAEEGAILNDNCFEDQANYTKFKAVFDKCSSVFSAFNQVIDYINNDKNITYCASDLTPEKLKALPPEKQMAAGEATRPSNPFPFVILKWKDHSIFNPEIGISKLLYGMVDFDPKDGFNNNTVFHEFIHAAQFIYDINNKIQTLEARQETEVRVIILYSVYKNAPKDAKKDANSFTNYLYSIIGSSYVQFPLIDMMISAGANNNPDNDVFSGYTSISGLYSNPYEAFSGYFEAKMNNTLTKIISDDFRVLLWNYSEWLKIKYTGYSKMDTKTWNATNNNTPFFDNYIK